jgi:hypothetical protein
MTLSNDDIEEMIAEGLITPTIPDEYKEALKKELSKGDIQKLSRLKKKLDAAEKTVGKPVSTYVVPL